LPPSKAQVAKGETNLGQATLLNRIRELVLGQVEELDVTLPLRDARTISLIESQGKVLDRNYSADAVTLRVKMGRKQIDRMRGTGIRMTLRTAGGVLIPGPDAPRNAWNAQN
jgi:50S ribosomal subunit-associated GTPase HflX